MSHCGPGPDPGTWHHDRPVRGRHARDGAVGRDDYHGRRRLMAKRTMPELDAVTLEVIRNALPAVANEMAAALQRPSYNMMIYEVRDFCTALVGLEGELISQNVGGVSHFVADLGVIVTDGLARSGKAGFRPGDVIITNHQAVAGQHLNNVVIYAPYFYRGELLMFTMVRAHWIDVGGPLDGGAAARPAQDLRGGRPQRDALPRPQGQHPVPRILARGHEVPDG